MHLSTNVLQPRKLTSLAFQSRFPLSHVHCRQRSDIAPFSYHPTATRPLAMASATGPIPSPHATLIPFLTPQDAATLAYPPNALPGARNVNTFYGTMRVYEWGPRNGDKVLFVHGDATPCPVFANIAQGLVDAGHRVMLFGKHSPHKLVGATEVPGLG